MKDNKIFKRIRENSQRLKENSEQFRQKSAQRLRENSQRLKETSARIPQRIRENSARIPRPRNPLRGRRLRPRRERRPRQRLQLKNTPLTNRIKFLYASADWGASAATAARNTFWFLFMTSVVGLDAGLAGTVFLVGKLWDGVNDPLVGTISDRLQTRWGRRRPFLLFGAIPFGIAFFLMFVVPPIESPIGLTIYYIIVFLIFDTLYTLTNVPYTALTAEITQDYDERSELAGWRIGVSIFAMLVTAAGFKLLAEEIFAPWFGTGTEAVRAGYALVAAIWGVTFMIPIFWLGYVLEEPETVPDTDPINPVHTFKEVFANKPFRYGAVMYMLSFATGDIILLVFIRFLIDYVQVTPGYENFVLALILGIALISMPLVVKGMQKYGKRNAYLGSMFFMAIVMVIISQIPPGGQTLVTIAAIFAGLGFGAANTIPWAIVADVVEEDELRTGKRREGLYAGYLVLARKLTSAFAIFIVGQVLSYSGFISTTTGSAFVQQPESALRALRFFVGGFPAIMLVIAIAVGWFYPLDKARYEAIRLQLLARQMGWDKDVDESLELLELPPADEDYFQQAPPPPVTIT
ncbi:MAG TPA: MFS transporter [Anaerolineae bacterium]|nr:MFS transporter [Anaerolineae bacterium]